MFRIKSKEQNFNYYFKVADPYENEEKRKDKLCIYFSLEDAQKFFEILQEIKNENPQISFAEPPILTGRVDEWLGVASDYKERKKKCISKNSYNSKMSDIVMEAIEKVFNGVDRKEIPDKIKNNSDSLESLRKEITTLASQLGYSKEKICVRESDKRKLKKGSKMTLFDRIKGLFLKRKQLPPSPSSSNYLKNKRKEFIWRTSQNINTNNENICGKTPKSNVQGIKQFSDRRESK